MEKKKGFFLVVAGNIGVGKTTFTRLIHKQLGWKPYFEKVDENPYLKRFYQNMQHWGFHSQIYFLTQRFKAHLQINEVKEPITQDRSIYEDAEVFARNLYEQGILTGQDYNTYRDLYESMVRVLKSPDLTIYLRASPWTLVSRIRKRWRDIERDIDKEYLFQLNLCYERWIRDWQKLNFVQIIETDGRDFLEEAKWTRKIIDQLYHVFQMNQNERMK